MNWDNINVKQFTAIQQIVGDPDMEIYDRMISLISVIFGIDATQITLADYQKHASQLAFLKDPVVKNDLEPEYVLNGRRYYFHTNPNMFNLAQVTDYQNYIGTNNPINNLANTLSVLLIPTGHTYNDGYDISQTIADIETMSIRDAMACFFYYEMLLKRSVSSIQKYLQKQIKKSKTKNKNLQSKVKELDLVLSQLY